jgi:hypothetical protein
MCGPQKVIEVSYKERSYPIMQYEKLTTVLIAVH